MSKQPRPSKRRSHVAEPPRRHWSFYLDECCSGAIGDLLHGRGHTVYRVGIDVPYGTSDRFVAERARDLGAVVVTENEADFVRLSGRRSPHKDGSVRLRGCVVVQSKADAARRLEQVVTVVEALLDESESLKDQRAFIQIRENRIVLVR